MTTGQKRVVVIHGANLDMLGRRPQEHYGSWTLKELERIVCKTARDMGWRCLCRHTNHEGEYVEFIHKYRNEGALIVNPGAWTHYSYAIRDALEIVECPVAEVHLSDLTAREEWRRQSVVSPVVQFTVTGKGVEGYVDALRYLDKLVRTRTMPSV